jgi:hypothetical protein
LAAGAVVVRCEKFATPVETGLVDLVINEGMNPMVREAPRRILAAIRSIQLISPKGAVSKRAVKGAEVGPKKVAATARKA